MTTCTATGWGTGPYGQTAWGGGLDALPGGPLPVVEPFDVYCVGPCGPMSFILTYNEVEEDGDPLQFAIAPTTLDLQLGSGGVFPDDDVRVTINTIVPATLTLDFTVKFDSLPPNFNDLVYKHIFIGVSNAAGYCAGLFFSKTGVAYTGSVHHASGALPDQNLLLDSVVQPLPGSDLLISEGEYYSFRLAIDSITGTTYLFITKTAELVTIGHQLRFVLPSILSSSCVVVPPDRTLLSLRGTLGAPSVLALDSLCLGSELIIPNLPPVADAGLDQAVRTCSIVQLNGERSHDPEGGALTFQWRLIDAPVGSLFMFDGLDGTTFDTLSDFTNKLYSSSLSALDVIDPIALGDVLVVGGAAHTIELKGTDVNGFYVQIQGFYLSDTLVNVPFKMLRQRSISGPTAIKPTFYPDLPGFYKFDLTVNDGQLLSEPAVTIVSVSESPQPRGCIPDVSFLWDYLSDFWNLIDDRQPVEVLWGAVAQVAAAELLSLWQIDYSKSLRDVQRTFQRRWLHYDLSLREPFPDTATMRPVMGGVRQLFPATGIAIASGSTLTIAIPVFNKSSVLTFPSSLPVELGNVGPTAQAVADFLTPLLTAIDPRFSVRVTTNRVTAEQELRIDAPFTFHNAPTDTAPIFSYPFANGMPTGSGAGVGVKSYKVDRSLQGVDLREGDLLSLAGSCFRIARVVDDTSDAWPFQRITLLDELPPDTGTSWAIPGKLQSKFIDFYNALVWVNDLLTFEIFDVANSTETFLTVAGAHIVPTVPQTVGVDLTTVANYLLLPGTFESVFYGLQRLNYVPLDPLVVDIPYLQERIKNSDDTSVLRRNLDFFIETYRGRTALRFAFGGFGSGTDIWQDASAVPARLWAEITYLDNNPTIEQNFGFPASFTLDDLSQLPAHSDYLSIIRGLWFAYFNGPTLFNLRAGTQILLGLPFAEEAGVIKEIRTDFSPTQGRLLIQDRMNPEVVRSYTYPVDLALEINPATSSPYAVGDTVAQFAPLITGATVVDYIKDPQWIQGYIGQGTLFEVEKFFRFMVRVDSPAFSLSTLLFVKSFVLRVKPTYTYPLFIVLRTVDDTEVSTADDLEYSGQLYLHDGACFDQTLGAATMWDEPRPAGGGWRSQYDNNVNPDTIPVYPTSEPVQWGFDKKYLCPEDFVEGSVCIEWAGGIPTYDSIFAFDTEVFQQSAYFFEDANIAVIPADSNGISLYDNPTSVTANGTITDLLLTISGGPGEGSPDYYVVVRKNLSDQAPVPITVIGDPFVYHATVSIPVTIGDLLSVRIVTAGGEEAHVEWSTVSVQLGASAMWSFDTPLAAGTYCVYKTL